MPSVLVRHFWKDEGNKMKILWLCNIIIPAIADKLGIESTNKEGWISGLFDRVLREQGENGIALSVAFPAPMDMCREGEGIFQKALVLKGIAMACYGFYEDVTRPDRYDASLEEKLRRIVQEAEPDVVHCFGTEYPHTLALCRVFPRKDRVLLGIQGLCAIYARAYFADLPEEVIRQITFRDWLKKDSLRQQQEKFEKRGAMEREAVTLAGNITGRTAWDESSTKAWNGRSRYFHMNETLRPVFYGPVWDPSKCVPHSIFLSQGDYPIKGLHYMLAALPAIAARYPDVTVCVAGNSIVEYGTWKQKLKISAYGKYLRSLLEREQIRGKVRFLGRQNAEQMLGQYLRSHLYVCCSSMENSPNSLGEAMLLGMPCVSADVGGITSLFTDGVDGIVYEGGTGGGTQTAQNESPMLADTGGNRMEQVAGRLADAVIRMWDDKEQMVKYCKNAREHALRTHDGENNYHRLVEIYDAIAREKQPDKEFT